MHIAIDARLYGLKHAGIGRYVLHLIKELSNVDSNNHYTLIVAPDTQLAQLPRNAKLITSDIRHYSLAEQIRFVSQLNAIDADLFHFPHFNVPLAFNRPYVVTIHDLLWHEKVGFEVTTLPKYVYLAKYVGYRLVIHQAITRAKHVLTPAQAVKDSIIAKFNQPASKITVTHEAADQVYFSAKKNLSILKKYQIKSPYIVYTGSLYPHKNVDRVVEALRKIEEVRLIIASARNIFTDRFWQRVVDLGMTERVHLLGFVPDDELAQIYCSALALVQPSQSEGFGLTGLEAMATGLPVICSRHSVMEEIYGQAAIFVDTTSALAIAQAIETFRRDTKLWQKMSRTGRTQAEQYGWDKLAQQTNQAYQQVLLKP